MEKKTAIIGRQIQLQDFNLDSTLDAGACTKAIQYPERQHAGRSPASASLWLSNKVASSRVPLHNARNPEICWEGYSKV